MVTDIDHKNESGLIMNRKDVDNSRVGLNKTKRVRRPKEPSPFTNNLKALLKERGISIRKAAGICDVSPSVVSQWTSGSQPADTRPLLRLCEHLGADFQNLLTGIPSRGLGMTNLTEIFEIEKSTELSGIFLIEAKRLKPRKKGSL